MKEPYLDAFGRTMDVGARVRYVPMHAHGDLNHPDCEIGIVTSWNDEFVFVRYRGNEHSKATKPDDLTVQIKQHLNSVPPSTSTAEHGK